MGRRVMSRGTGHAQPKYAKSTLTSKLVHVSTGVSNIGSDRQSKDGNARDQVEKQTFYVLEG